MTPRALQDLLAPPEAYEASDGPPARDGVDAMAEALLQRLREEDRAPARVDTQALSPEAADALYAWGVACYEQQRHEDAGALFGALARRCPPSLRLCKALGAARLARGNAEAAAEAFARAGQLAPDDAEAVFHHAQAEWLRARPADALQLLETARRLAQAAPSKWPDLPAWCDELAARLPRPPSPLH